MRHYVILIVLGAMLIVAAATLGVALSIPPSAGAVPHPSPIPAPEWSCGVTH